MTGRFFAALLLCLPLATDAQNGLINTAVFRTADGQPSLEAVWQVEPRRLHYRRQPGDSTIAARYKTDVILANQAGGPAVARESYLVNTPAVTPERAAGAFLFDSWQKTVPAGKYNLTVRITEPGFEELAFVLSAAVEVPALIPPALSVPQLLDTFYKTNTVKGALVKGGMQLVPLTADFLGDERREARWYLEAYGLDKLPAAHRPLRLKTGILRRNTNTPIQQATDTLGGALLPVQPLTGVIGIGTVPSGNYTLTARVEDAGGNLIAYSERPFQRSNAKPDAVMTTVEAAGKDTAATNDPMVLPDLKKSFVGSFKPSQLPAVLRMILPISTAEEGLAIQSLLRHPSADISRPFIYRTFAQRNPKDPDAAWAAYADQVRVVNREFRRGPLAGYETDRGRIQLHYGPPDERVRVSAEPGTRAYEVWVYNNLAKSGDGASFLFYQAGTQIDDYVLLHSTAPAETRNLQWRRYLYTDPQAVNRARAEQYFPAR